MLFLFFGDLHLPYFHTKSCIDSYNMLQPMLNSLVSKMVPFVESQGGAELQRKAGRKTWVQSGMIGGSHHLHELSYSPNDWGGFSITH